MTARSILILALALAIGAADGARGDPDDAFPDRPVAEILVVETDPFTGEAAEPAASDRTSFTVRAMAPGETVESDAPAASGSAGSDDYPVYRIRTGDILQISIPYEPDSTKTVPVRPDGRINYLFDIEVMAAGRTYAEVNAALVDALGRYYKNPRVTVIGQSFAGNSVFVMGPVKSPGRHPIQHNTRLLDVLSTSGAMSILQQAALLEEEAASEVINLQDAYLAREEADGEMRVLDVDFHALLMKQDMSQNVRLHPRDFIFLPSAFSTQNKVYIVGQVKEPQVYRYTGSITFVEAIAHAEGARESGAWIRRCFIIRGGVKETREVIHINYAEMLVGKTPDVPLQNGDIVLVPKTPLAKTTEVINSVLAPLRALSDLDNTMKNDFREGHRMYKDIPASRAFGF